MYVHVCILYLKEQFLWQVKNTAAMMEYLVPLSLSSWIIQSDHCRLDLFLGYIIEYNP